MCYTKYVVMPQYGTKTPSRTRGRAFFSYAFFLRFFLDEIKCLIECRDVKKEEKNYDQGVEHGMSANHIIKNIVGCAIACHQEHIVVVDQDVDGISHYAEGPKDGEGDINVLFLHTDKTGDGDVKRAEARD